MKFLHRRSQEIEEGESYYVSMTDMMVGVVFIFIIMLSYFALQFRTTTATLTQAKDAQTAALMQIATHLAAKTVTVQVDADNHIVCIPGSALSPGLSAENHCFAYSDTSNPNAPMTADDRSAALAKADQSELMNNIDSDLKAANVNAATNATAITLSSADIFEPGSATLSQNGQTTVDAIAQTLTKRMGCYVSGASASGCDNSSSLGLVVVSGHAMVDPGTQAGRDAAALVLQRSAAFYAALLQAQPDLGKMKTPTGGPLVRVSSGLVETPGQTQAETITVQLQMAARS